MNLVQALVASEYCADETEAAAEVRDAKRDFQTLLRSGGDVADLEDFCGERWGLEPDYLEELLP